MYTSSRGSAELVAHLDPETYMVEADTLSNGRTGRVVADVCCVVGVSGAVGRSAPTGCHFVVR